MHTLNRIFIQLLFATSFISLLSCRSSSQLVSIESERIEMTSIWDNEQSMALTILSPYQEKVDSIMSPVVGICAIDMSARRPESLLSNLVADVLRDAAVSYLGQPADLALINIGGLRNSLKAGEITYGDIFEILPFENTVCIVSLKGKYIDELVQNILIPGGEGISNLRINATPDKKIRWITIGGEPVDEERIYKIATIDYLAEGNDKMSALLKAEEKLCFAEKTIREVFLDYVKAQTLAGKEIISETDGRLTIE